MIRTLVSRVTGLMLALTSFSAAQAHPGHSLSEAGVSHTLTSPDHLAGLTAGGLLLFAAAYLARESRARRLLCQGGAVALLGAALVWSLGV
jgi:hydrogenase/urease accessory protein HupE